VLASAAGTVSQVGRDGEVTNPPHGNFVYIDHGGGWVTNYLHLRDAPLVAKDQVVNAGQQIGVVGNTATEVHLHYSQWSDGNAVRVQFNGSDINTWTGNLSPWGNGERLTSRPEHVVGLPGQRGSSSPTMKVIHGVAAEAPLRCGWVPI
jgi:murein DD-endopeptidase MepM/ murein hydrolase activator NlpD